MISGSRFRARSARSPTDVRSSGVPTFQSASLPGLPAGGPVTVQPSMTSPSSSNDVVPWPPGPTIRSTMTPGRLTTVVGHDAEGDLDLLAGVRAEIEGPVLEAVAAARRRVPGTGRTGGQARLILTVVPLVMGEEGVQAQPERAAVAGVGRGVAFGIGQRRPAARPDLMGLGEEEVEVRLGVAEDVEAQPPTARWHRERPGQPLVRGVGRAGDRVLGPERLRLVEQPRIDRVDVANSALLVRPHGELTDGRRRQVGRHRCVGHPRPGRLAPLPPDAREVAVRDHLQGPRNGHPERVRRLVRRMVVDREPGGRDVGFADDDHAVLGREHPADSGHVHGQFRDPVIADGDGEPGAPPQCLRPA